MLAHSTLLSKRAFRLLMADGPHPDGPAGRGGRSYQGWPGPARGGGAQPVLDLGFDSGMLPYGAAKCEPASVTQGFLKAGLMT